MLSYEGLTGQAMPSTSAMRQLESLSTQEVKYLLINLNMSKFTLKFFENDVNGGVLYSLTKVSDLIDLGINVKVKARIFFNEISEFKISGVPGYLLMPSLKLYNQFEYPNRSGTVQKSNVNSSQKFPSKLSPKRSVDVDLYNKDIQSKSPKKSSKNTSPRSPYLSKVFAPAAKSPLELQPQPVKSPKREREEILAPKSPSSRTPKTARTPKSPIAKPSTPSTGFQGKTIENRTDNDVVYDIGNTVEVNFKSRGAWYPGTITKVVYLPKGSSNNDEESQKVVVKYDIAYDDGDQEFGVVARLIRHFAKITSPIQSPNNIKTIDSILENLNPLINRRVEANYHGYGVWYKGSIEKVNEADNFDIIYDDGDRENGVERSRVRGIDGTAFDMVPSQIDSTINQSTAISHLHTPNTTANENYYSEELEVKRFPNLTNVPNLINEQTLYKADTPGVSIHLSRSPVQHSTNRDPNSAFISNQDDSYDQQCLTVAQSPGNNQVYIKPSPINASNEPLLSSRQSPISSSHTVSNTSKPVSPVTARSTTRDKLESFAKNQSPSVSMANREMVPTNALFVLESASSEAIINTMTEKQENGVVIKLGDRVEVDWKGKGKWYDGNVTGCCLVGEENVYNIRYNDGDEETNVPASRIHILSPVDSIKTHNGVNEASLDVVASIDINDLPETNSSQDNALSEINDITNTKTSPKTYDSSNVNVLSNTEDCTDENDLSVDYIPTTSTYIHNPQSCNKNPSGENYNSTVVISTLDVSSNPTESLVLSKVEETPVDTTLYVSVPSKDDVSTIADTSDPKTESVAYSSASVNTSPVVKFTPGSAPSNLISSYDANIPSAAVNISFDENTTNVDSSPSVKILLEVNSASDINGSINPIGESDVGTSADVTAPTAGDNSGVLAFSNFNNLLTDINISSSVNVLSVTNESSEVNVSTDTNIPSLINLPIDVIDSLDIGVSSEAIVSSNVNISSNINRSFDANILSMASISSDAIDSFNANGMTEVIAFVSPIVNDSEDFSVSPHVNVSSVKNGFSDAIALSELNDSSHEITSSDAAAPSNVENSTVVFTYSGDITREIFFSNDTASEDNNALSANESTLPNAEVLKDVISSRHANESIVDHSSDIDVYSNSNVLDDHVSMDSNVKSDVLAISTPQFEIGDKIEANWMNKGQWYKGTIYECTDSNLPRGENKLYLVKYDDGDEENDVPASRIRRDLSTDAKELTSDMRRTKREFIIGDFVEANYRGIGKWYPGKISGYLVTSNKNINSPEALIRLYNINYNDGDVEKFVSAEYIRKLADEPLESSTLKPDELPILNPQTSLYSLGDKIEVNYKGRGEWIPGRISNLTMARLYESESQGLPCYLYSVTHDDSGDEENNVLAECIRFRSKYHIDQLIECNYKGNGRWFSAVVLGITYQSSGYVYSVRYDDNEEVSGVDESFIRLYDSEVSSSDDMRCNIANGGIDNLTRVLADYKLHGSWYPGTIIGYNHKDTPPSYLVKFDGIDSQWCNENDLRLEKDLSFGEYFVDELVNVKSRLNTNDLSRAKIVSVHPERTFDIIYIDENQLLPSEFRILSERLVKIPSKLNIYEVNEKVEASYRGRGKWYSGTISYRSQASNDQLVSDDASNFVYSILYDDGQVEEQVAPHFIRHPFEATKKPENNLEQFFPLLELGVKVEANYKGRGKWYSGTVTRNDRRDESGMVVYDISYDDKGSEVDIRPQCIRYIGEINPIYCSPNDVNHVLRSRPVSACPTNTSDALSTGLNNNKNKELAHEASEFNNTSDALSNEKLIDVDNTISKSLGKLREGDRVEANYRGRGKWYLGKISSDHGDKTYDIAYDDGESEHHVNENLIRKLNDTPVAKLETAIASPVASEVSLNKPSINLREGDRVEANYRGRGKWYQGKISRDHGDKTYDIAYDDGESEHHVNEKLIRKLNDTPVAKLETAIASPVASSAVDQFLPQQLTYDSPQSRQDYPLSPELHEHEGELSFLYHEGQRVRVNSKGKGIWRTGKISKIRSARSFNIIYDDGESEIRVSADNITALDS